MKPSSTATPKERTPRSFWFDPRFAIGLGLVVLSILGVFTIVSATDTSVEVYAARSALAPGDRIDANDLVLRSVRLGELEADYLAVDDVPADGLVVTRTVSDGELVPTAAVGSGAGVRVASVVVRLREQLPKSVAAGSVVDLWAASETESQDFGPPAVLASSATVVRVIGADGLVAGQDGGSIEVLVERTKVARVLEAIANEDAVSAIPVSLPIGD